MCSSDLVEWIKMNEQELREQIAFDIELEELKCCSLPSEYGHHYQVAFRIAQDIVRGKGKYASQAN